MRKFLSRYVLALLIPVLALGCVRAPTGEGANSPAAWRDSLQPPLAADEALMLEELSLAEAIHFSALRNPGLQAMRSRWLTAIHVEPQAMTPPDPMLTFGYQFDNVETRVGPQEWNLGVSQKIPWFQKLWARGRLAATKADIAYLQYETAYRDLIIEVKDAYYELYYLDQAHLITEKIETLLRNDALLAYAELESGRTQLNEAFRAESQAAQLAYDRILLEELRAAQAERLRSLLNLPPDTEIGPVRTAPLYEVADDLPALYQRAEQFASMLRIRGLELQQAEYQTYLAKLARVPDVTIGTNFIQTSSSRAAAAMRPADSGKDPFIGMLAMNLPIWENRNQALIREKQALEEARISQALNELNKVRQGVAKAFFQVRLTNRLSLLYLETLLPQAENVMRQAELNFRNEQASFANLIETTLAYHNFQLAYHRALADSGQAIGRLEKVLGATAESRADDPPPSSLKEEDQS